ncbi:MAG: hypothetical protein R2911_27275 [Caldilineaceae bacterium]
MQEKVNLLRLRLPDDAEEPIVRRFNPSDNPIMRFGVADRRRPLARRPAHLGRRQHSDPAAARQAWPPWM